MTQLYPTQRDTIVALPLLIIAVLLIFPIMKVSSEYHDDDYKGGSRITAKSSLPNDAALIQSASVYPATRPSVHVDLQGTSEAFMFLSSSPPPKEEFETIIHVTHNMADFGGTTDKRGDHKDLAKEAIIQDASLMEALILKIFNEQSERSGDPQRKRLTSVQSKVNNYQTSTQESLNRYINNNKLNPNPPATVDVEYTLRGVCSHCGSAKRGVILFQDDDDTKRESRRQLTSTTKRDNNNHLRGSDSDDDLPPEDEADGSFSQEAFLVALNEAMDPCSDPHTSCADKRPSFQIIHSASKVRQLQVQVQVQVQQQDFVEIVEYECNPTEIRPLQTSVRLDLNGSAWMFASNWTGVEHIFEQTYNDLVFSSCDWPHFRTVQSVTASPDSYNLTTNTTSVYFTVLAECRDCPSSSTPLFDDAFATDQSVASYQTTTGGPPVIQSTTRQTNNPTSCFCPKSVTDFRAPTEKEFMNVFEPAVLEAEEEDLLRSTMEETIEEVTCSPNILTFTSYAYVDVHVKASAQPLSDSEKAALEQGFRSTYNRLSFLSCDSHFRNIVDVTLERDINTGGLSSSERKESGFILSIVGQCRDCPITPSGSSTLFDDDEEQQQRSLSETSSVSLSDLSPSRRNVQEESATCVCPTAELQLEGFSKDEFLTHYNEEVKKLQQEGFITAVDTVQGIEEAQEVECSEDVQTFTSTVYADVNVSLNELGLTQKALLENAFKTSYNGLAYSVCDNLFRTVVDVNLQTEVDFDPFERRLQDIKYGDMYGGNGTFFYNSTFNSTTPPASETQTTVFAVTGQCRNCAVSDTGSFNLFDEAFRRRRLLLQYQQQRRWSHARRLQDSAASCLCPAGTQPGESEGLSAEEFKAVFNEQVQEEQQEGALKAVDVVVDDVLEGQQVECGSNVSHFRSEVFSDLQVNLTSLTIDEVSALEESFQRTYNNLAFGSCDGYFRAVERVELRIGRPEKIFPNRRLQETSNFTGNETYFDNSTAAPVSLYVGSTLFSVTGSCRNCPVSQTGSFNLFDDAFRRVLTGRNYQRRKGDISRKLQTSSSNCICPIGEEPQIDRGPTALEFENVFIEELAEMEEKGKATSVAVTATSVAEGEEVACSPDVQEFQTATYADLGVNPTELSLQEKAILEASFLDAYNSLSFAACDGYFRIVAEVKLVVESYNLTKARRLQQQGESLDLNTTLPSLNETTNATAANETSTEFENTHATQANSALFVVTGRCRNCPVSDTGSFTLFDDSFRRARRDLKRRPRSGSGWRRNMEEDVNLCICPVGTEPGEEPAPTIEEFVEELNTKIEESKEEEGVNITVKEIPTVIEVEPQGRTIPDSPNSTKPPVPTPTSPAPLPVPTNISGTAAPVPASTPGPSKRPTNPPSPAPTQEPTPQPTPEPTMDPTVASLEPSEEPTRQPTVKPSAQPTTQPTFPPTFDPTAKATNFAASAQPSLAPSDVPSKHPFVDPTSSPSGLPSAYPSATPSSSPSELGCNKTFADVEALYAVTYSGNLEAMSDLDLEDSFTLADAALDKTECSPVVLSASVQQRTYRRRLQTGSSNSLVVFIIESLQTSNGFMFQSEAESAPFLTSLNSMGRMQVNNVEATGIQGYRDTLSPSGSPTGSPSLSPSTIPSTIPSGTPSASPSTIPSGNPSAQPSRGPSVTPSAAPSASPSLRPSLPPSTLSPTVTPGSPSNCPTRRPTQSPTVKPTKEPTLSPTASPTTSPTKTPTDRPTTTPSLNPTFAPSGSPSSAPTGSPTTQPSISPSLSPTTGSPTTANPIATPDSPTKQPTRNPTQKPSLNPTGKPSTEPSSESPTKEPTASPTKIPTGAPTQSPSRPPTLSPTQSPTPIPTPVPTNTPTGTPTEAPTTSPSTAPITESPTTPNPTVTASFPSRAPTAVPTKKPTTSPTRVPTSTPSTTPTFSHTQSPSITPTNSPSQCPSFMPSAAPSATPTTSPLITPSGSPSQCPTVLPSAPPTSPTTTLPSMTPTAGPSQCPTVIPSVIPTLPPTISPSSAPTGSPTGHPSGLPSVIPTSAPTKSPSRTPSSSPTGHPSGMHSATPTSPPTNLPSKTPTGSPSQSPTSSPTKMPSISPTKAPTGLPSTSPTLLPTSLPTKGPTMLPTKTPTKVPTGAPSPAPTFSPTTPVINDRAELVAALNSGIFDSTSQYGPIETWDVTRVTDMNAVFRGRTTFNEDISSWDTSAVTNLNECFSGAIDFNQNLNLWDVSNVSWMRATFFNTGSFNGDVSNWQVQKAIFMDEMFASSAFNGDISSWAPIEVRDMEKFFQRGSFNSPIPSWDVSKCANLGYFFWGNSNFNQDISGWNISGATSLYEFFYGATSFDQDLTGWVVTKVTRFGRMFFGATSFNRDLSTWDMSAATNAAEMFSGATSFNQDHCLWGSKLIADVTVTNMFSGAALCPEQSDPDLSASTAGPFCHICMPTASPTKMPTKSPTSPPTSMPTTSPTKTPSMAPSKVPTMPPTSTPSKAPSASPTRTPTTSPTKGPTSTPTKAPTKAPSITPSKSPTKVPTTSPTTGPTKVPTKEPTKVPTQTPTKFPTAPPTETPGYSFPDKTSLITALEELDYSASGPYGAIDTWDVTKITNFDNLISGSAVKTTFNTNIEGWDVSGVTSMSALFKGATSYNQPLNLWDVGLVANMNELFSGATIFNQSLNNWNTANCGWMRSMFYNADAFNADVSTWNVEKVLFADSIFDDSAFNGDISSWNFAEVRNLQKFNQRGVFNQPIPSWNLPKCSEMGYMFWGNFAFNQDISGWSTTAATSMYEMFFHATSFDQDLSVGAWTVSKVTNFGRMFIGASSFNQNLSSWDMTAAENLAEMFNGASSFNQDLCAWGLKIGTQATVTNMFVGATACDQGDPDFTGAPPGPFCRVCPPQ